MASPCVGPVTQPVAVLGAQDTIPGSWCSLEAGSGLRSIPCVIPSLSDETVEEARALGNLRMGIFALDKV